MATVTNAGDPANILPPKVSKNLIDKQFLMLS